MCISKLPGRADERRPSNHRSTEPFRIKDTRRAMRPLRLTARRRVRAERLRAIHTEAVKRTCIRGCALRKISAGLSFQRDGCAIGIFVRGFLQHHIDSLCFRRLTRKCVCPFPTILRRSDSVVVGRQTCGITSLQRTRTVAPISFSCCNRESRKVTRRRGRAHQH